MRRIKEEGNEERGFKSGDSVKARRREGWTNSS